jgi:predicted O-methyltransferase YrrM
VEIRVGDALETPKHGIDGDVDLVLLDGAFSLYLPVLKLLEPHLRDGALVIGDNALETIGIPRLCAQPAERLSVSSPAVLCRSR